MVHSAWIRRSISLSFLVYMALFLLSGTARAQESNGVGARVTTVHDAVEIRLIADVGQRGPFPVLEAAVRFHANKTVDLELTQERGIAVLANNVASSAVVSESGNSGAPVPIPQSKVNELNLSGVDTGGSVGIGAQPRDGQVRPEDLTATILHCLGHGPDTHMHDTLNRPIPVSRGQVVRQILA